MRLLRTIATGILLAVSSLMGLAQPAIPAGQVDLFMGVDFHYRDIFYRRLYDMLINLTPSMKWNMGKGWQTQTQVLVPVYNDYGGRYSHVRLNIASLSKELSFQDRLFVKASCGLFSEERYGIDLKGMFTVNDWFAIEAQTGITGYCLMADGWEASKLGRWTGLVGADLYIGQYNTQIRVRGGRYIYKDYGGIVEVMRHFRHCTVCVYGEYSDKGKENAGFKVVMMLPPYKRRRNKVNFRPASNFRLTYNMDADAYANRMYKTEPEENEREGWFDVSSFHWGRNAVQQDFTEKSRTTQSKEGKE